MPEVMQVTKNEFGILTASMKGGDYKEIREAHNYFYDNNAWFDSNTIALALVEEYKFRKVCFGYLLSRLDGDERTISRLYVARDQRGKGYAEKLINEIEKKHNKIRIKCLEKVKKFWLQQGYNISKECDGEGYYVGYKQA